MTPLIISNLLVEFCSVDVLPLVYNALESEHAVVRALHFHLSLPC